MTAATISLLSFQQQARAADEKEGVSIAEEYTIEEEEEDEPAIVMRDIRTVLITGVQSRHRIRRGDKICKNQRLKGDFSLSHVGESKGSEI